MAARSALAQVIANSRFVKRWLARDTSDNGHLFQMVVELATHAQPLLDRIPVRFPEYTPHDFFLHFTNVLDVLDWMILPPVFNSLSNHDIFFITAAALVHDIGMAVGVTQEQDIRASGDFRHFRDNLENELLQLPDEHALFREYVRRNHHLFSSNWIRTYFSSVEPGFGEVLGLLAESHGLDLSEVLANSRFDSSFAFQQGEIADVPSLAIILRLADLFDMTRHRTPWHLYDFLEPSDPESDFEWKKHLSTLGIARHGTRERTVVVTAVCEQPTVYHRIRRFEDYVRRQIESCASFLANSKASIDLAIDQIEFNISTRGFEATDWRFIINQETIIDLLMGHRLYSDPVIAVRELIQNSLDAVQQRVKVGPRDYEPQLFISLSYIAGRWILTIEDNGIGMDQHTIEDFLLQAGKPYFQSVAYRQMYLPEERIESVGQFGIGFLSVFMVAERVSLDTMKVGQRPIRLEMTDILSYVVARVSDRTSPGTKIEIVLKPEIVVSRGEVKEDVIDNVEDLSQRPTIRRAPRRETFGYSENQNPATTPLLKEWSDPGSPYRVFHPTANVSVLSVEAILNRTVGYIDCAVFYKEPWEQEFKEFSRPHRVPPTNCIVLTADRVQHDGLHGLVVLHGPVLFGEQRISQNLINPPDTISQNGIRLPFLESSRISDNGFPISYLELDLSGQSRVNLLASRENAEPASISQLRSKVTSFVSDSVRQYHLELIKQIGPSSANSRVLLEYFGDPPKNKSKLSFRRIERVIGDEFSSDVMIEHYLPVVGRHSGGEVVGTIPELKEKFDSVRLILGNFASKPRTARNPGTVDLPFTSDPRVIHHVYPVLEKLFGTRIRIHDRENNIVIVGPLTFSQPNFYANPQGSSPHRLIFGRLAGRKVWVHETDILGIRSYLINTSFPGVVDMEAIGMQDHWISEMREGSAAAITAMPAIPRLLVCLDALSTGSGETSTHIGDINDAVQEMMGDSGKGMHPTISLADLPNSWAIRISH